MFGVVHLLEYVIGTIVIVLLPGPNSMYCLSVATRHGVRIAYRSIIAIMLGDSILILATVLGVGTLLRTYPAIFNIMKLFGGGYLLWIGINLLYSAWLTYWQKPHHKMSTEIKPAQVFKRALTLSLSNPKAILFFLAFFVQFVDPNYPKPLIAFLVLAIILQIISFMYLNVLAFAGMSLRHFFTENRWLASAGMAMIGLLFCGFAVKLWTATL